MLVDFNLINIILKFYYNNIPKRKSEQIHHKINNIKEKKRRKKIVYRKLFNFKASTGKRKYELFSNIFRKCERIDNCSIDIRIRIHFFSSRYQEVKFMHIHFSLHASYTGMYRKQTETNLKTQ